MTTDVILRATDVHRSFGGVRAVDVDSFEVDRGSIVALIGPNGAGKTTFFNLLTGFERADGGSWHFEGHDLAGKPAYSIARTGMVRTFQSARVFPRLTVTDNVRLGAQDQRGERLGRSIFPWAWRSQDELLATRALELVEWVGLGAKATDLAGTLSGGQRKLLDLARAVMAAPTLLMLDEPMAGVNPALRQALLDKIGELPGEGITVLFVEHDMDVVSAISDRVVCMAEGTIIASGTPSEVAAEPRVVEAYLGGSSADLRDHERRTPRDVPVGDETADPVATEPDVEQIEEAMEDTGDRRHRAEGDEESPS
ncbi:MAG: ABC transporter ATP-binding protein [Actinomycetota bacterium]|nr:ABC transporter ATP-binding protein [Actinomycetota bacterium]